MKKFFASFVILFVLCGVALLFFNQNRYDFEIISQNGEGKISDFSGEYKILYFGYLFCPDVCPTTLFTLSNVLNKLKNESIKVIFVTLDPERDDVREMSEFAKNFYHNSIGVKAKNLEYTAKIYGVKFKKIDMPNSAMKYSVAHSSALYLLDKSGKYFSEVTNLTEDDINEEVQKLLAQRP